MPSYWVKSLCVPWPYTMVPLSSVRRGGCVETVFYDEHLASKKLANAFHAFYPHCRQPWREALAFGKDVLLMLLRSRVTSFKLFGTMAFSPQLPWLLFPLHWHHMTGWDLPLFSWVPEESSLCRVGDWEESAKPGPGWVFVCQGERWHLSLARSISQRVTGEENACLRSRLVGVGGTIGGSQSRVL